MKNNKTTVANTEQQVLICVDFGNKWQSEEVVEWQLDILNKLGEVSLGDDPAIRDSSNFQLSDDEFDLDLLFEILLNIDYSLD